MADNFNIEGMSCTNCAKVITKEVKKVPGVKNANVSLVLNYLHVDKDPSVKDEDIQQAVKSVGYKASPTNEVKFNKKLSKMTIIMIIKCCLAFVLTLPMMVGMFIQMAHQSVDYQPNGAELFLINPIAQMVVATIILFGIGYQFFIDFYQGIRHLQGNMAFLVVLGTMSAYILSIYVATANNRWESQWMMGTNHEHQLYFETIGMIVTFILLGKILESVAKNSTTNSLQSIGKLIPKTATLIVNGKEVNVNSSDIKVGDIVLVKPGEAVPTDGVIIQGSTHLNEAEVTGESKPVAKTVNGKVIAGTLNLEGAFQFKATAVVKENTVAQILNMVHDAQSHELHLAKIADKVATWFILVVVAAALITFGVNYAIGKGTYTSIVRAIATVIVACPCALGLATPTAIMVGTGKAAKHGIIFKDGSKMEELAKIKTIYLDKTGTLTEGKMNVTNITYVPSDYDQQTVDNYLYSLEGLSSHPIGTAVADNLKAKAKKLTVADVQNLPSVGLMGQIGQDKVLAAKPSYVKKLNQKVQTLIQVDQQEGKTVFAFLINDQVVAVVSLGDIIKPSAFELIKHLKAINVEPVMLTGDAEKTAQYVAKQLGISKVYSEVTIAQKADIVRSNQSKKHLVAMIGDGVNDTVALTAANVGLAMNNSLDVAKDSADVLIINNNLNEVYNAIVISREAIKKIKENLVWVFVYNAIMIPFAAVGWLPPELSAGIMALSSITIVINSLIFPLKKKLDHSDQKFISKTESKIDFNK